MFSEIVDIYNNDLRKRQAQAIRALRKVDRPLAKFALKRWKDVNEINKASVDMMLWGYGAVKVSHIPFADGAENSEIVVFPPWKS